MDHPLFFHYWISFSILILIVSGAAFYWTRKKGCYRDQDRARHLALWAYVPEDEANSKNESRDSQ